MKNIIRPRVASLLRVMAVILLAPLATLLLNGCVKTVDVTPTDDLTGNGVLQLRFEHGLGEAEFAYNTAVATAAHDTVRFTKIRYFVSNFSFVRTDGSVYTVPKDSSYHLITVVAGEDGVLNFTVPAGDYKTVRFIIGVDSAKSAAPLATRTGTLLPSANPDMYFSDTKGYVFVNLEGSSPQAPLSGGARLFSYHIGGYGNTTTTPVLNNIVQLSLDAPTANGGLPAKVRKTKTPEYHLHVDFMSLFNGDDTGMNVIRPATTPTIGFDANSTKARTNYAGMITVEHVHNY